jgi:hypothetical protein
MLRLNEGQIMPPVDGVPVVWTYDDRQGLELSGPKHIYPPD